MELRRQGHTDCDNVCFSSAGDQLRSTGSGVGYENNGISKSDNSSLNPNNNSQLPPPSAVIQNGGPSETVASAAVTTTPGMATNATFSRYMCFY